MFSEVTDELAMTSYTDDRTSRYFKDKSIREGLSSGFGNNCPEARLASARGRWMNGCGWSRGSAMWSLEKFILFDRGARKLTSQYRVREQLPREAFPDAGGPLSNPSDGLEIPAYITYPRVCRKRVCR